MYTCRPAVSVICTIERQHRRGGVLDRARPQDGELDVGRVGGPGAVVDAGATAGAGVRHAPASARSSSKKRSTAGCTPGPPEMPSQAVLIVPVSP